MQFNCLNKAKDKHYIGKGIKLGSLANLYFTYKQQNRIMDKATDKGDKIINRHVKDTHFLLLGKFNIKVNVIIFTNKIDENLRIVVTVNFGGYIGKRHTSM